MEIAPEDLFRHAIGAAEIAAVGDGDAQVAQRASQGVVGESRHGWGALLAGIAARSLLTTEGGDKHGL